MTAPSSNFSTAENWADIIRGVGQGAGSAMQGAAQYAGSKAEAKEAKRRTIAGLLSGALKRGQGVKHVGREFNQNISDYQANALQNVARGFVEALSGINTRGY